MSHIIFIQPNGLYCVFSTVTDCPLEWNLTRNDLILYEMRNEKEIIQTDLSSKKAKPFCVMDEYFVPNNMAVKTYNKIKQECSSNVSSSDPRLYSMSLDDIIKASVITNDLILKAKKKLNNAKNKPNASSDEIRNIRKKIAYYEMVSDLFNYYIKSNYERNDVIEAISNI